MMFERKSQLKIHEIKEQQEWFLQHQAEAAESDSLDSTLAGMMEFMQFYKAAMKSISTKLEVLYEEFQTHKHNPIHHLECRLKSLPSILKKMERYGIEPSSDTAWMDIQDIAGVRVICNFIDDIYEVEKLLLKQADVKLVKRKDYVAKPKESGYRSLHLIVTIPVFLSNGTAHIPVEIQLRTIAMDYWSSLEHMLRYKNSKDDIQRFSAMLSDCSSTLATTEKTMQYIRENIEQ